MARLRRDPEVEALIAAYRADLVATGQFAGNPMISPARSFLLLVGGVEGFSRLSLAEQCSISEHESRLVAWLIVTGRLRPSAEYLVASRLRAGRVAAWVHCEFHERFMRTAAELGFAAKSAELHWWAIALAAAIVGVTPDRLTNAQLDSARERLIAAMRRLDPDHPSRAQTLSPPLWRRDDAVSRRRDRYAAAQAQRQPVRPARERVGERPGAAGGHAAGVCRADAPCRCARDRSSRSSGCCASSPCG
ncbi:MAG: hypothetical protein WBP81_14715 [Solirubrobacteraceae bacterium]